MPCGECETGRDEGCVKKRTVSLLVQKHTHTRTATFIQEAASAHSGNSLGQSCFQGQEISPLKKSKHSQHVGLHMWRAIMTERFLISWRLRNHNNSEFLQQILLKFEAEPRRLRLSAEGNNLYCIFIFFDFTSIHFSILDFYLTRKVTLRYQNVRWVPGPLCLSMNWTPDHLAVDHKCQLLCHSAAHALLHT